MKKFFLTVTMSLAAAIVISCGNKSDGVIVKGSLSEFDSLSYATGIDLATGLKHDLAHIGLDYDLMKQGMENAALGGDVLVVAGDTVNADTYTGILQEFFGMKMRGRMAQLRKIESDTTGNAEAMKAALDFDPETLFVSGEEAAVVSSAFGFDIGTNLVNRGIPMTMVWILKGIDDTQNGTATMTHGEATDYLRNYFTVKIPAENKKASQEWLAEIEKQSGVKKTESGLLYKIESEGDISVKAVNDADKVKVHYKGTTRKGQVFDASRFADKPEAVQKQLKMMRPNDYNADQPIEFPLNRVIKGWTEGMKLVGKGGKITLWIPSELAYGERGASSLIGPNEALRFDVELIDVTPAE